MNITQMRYVYEVAKTKSMNKAAENLKVAQPNISRQIKVLEEELGIKIFERSTHGICLTIQGEEFVGYAKGVVVRFIFLSAKVRFSQKYTKKSLPDKSSSSLVYNALMRYLYKMIFQGGQKNV